MKKIKISGLKMKLHIITFIYRYNCGIITMLTRDYWNKRAVPNGVNVLTT